MDHKNLDRYHDRDSMAHRLDPRTKLLSALLFVLLVVLSPPGSWSAFGAYFAVISAVIVMSRIPLHQVLKRSLAVIPFVLMIAIFMPFFKGGEIAYSWRLGPVQMDLTAEGILNLETVLIKAWLSLLALVWLTSVTKVTGLIQAMRRLRVPTILVMIITLMYRYLFVIVDEAATMKQARDSRSPRTARIRELRSLGGIIGTLFIRSYERSERVYAAMAARGFDGEHRPLHALTFKKADVVFSACLGVVVVAIAICNYSVLVR